MTAKPVASIMLLLATLLPGTSHAQGRPLPCTISKILPVGTAGRGMEAPYVIHYQSTGGENCRTYRVANFAGHPSTAVVWKTANETLLDVELPACPANTVCPWVTARKAGQLSEIGTSTLVYGKAGEYSHSTQTFVAKVLSASELPDYGTFLGGVIANSAGTFTTVGVEVVSQVEGTGPYRLTYRLSLVVSKIKIPARAHLVLEPPDHVSIWSAKGKSQEPADLTVAWGAVTEDFLHRRAGQEPVPVLSEHSPQAVVTVPARAIKLKRIPLVFRSGQHQFAMTSAPAYLPVK